VLNNEIENFVISTRCAIISTESVNIWLVLAYQKVKGKKYFSPLMCH
jgi:hypothetical protein